MNLQSFDNLGRYIYDFIGQLHLIIGVTGSHKGPGAGAPYNIETIILNAHHRRDPGRPTVCGLLVIMASM